MSTVRRTDPTDPGRDVGFEPIEEPADCACTSSADAQGWAALTFLVIAVVLVVIGVVLS